MNMLLFWMVVLADILGEGDALSLHPPRIADSSPRFACYLSVGQAYVVPHCFMSFQPAASNARPHVAAVARHAKGLPLS
jgi:hypothetical protein